MTKNDTEDLTRFLNAQQSRLSRLAYVLTGDLGDSEDLVQDVMVKTVASWGRVRKLDDPTAYCSRMMINLARDWGRRRKRAMELAPTAPVEALDGGGLGPGDVINRITVTQMLALLTVRQRTVIYLRYYEDLSVSDVADRMNCSTGTVKSQTARALELLRQGSTPLTEAHHD